MKSTYLVAGLIASSLSFTITSATSAAPVRHSAAALQAWNSIEREDYDAGEQDANSKPAFLCSIGGHSTRFSAPALACIVAYEEALQSRAYDEAMRHAADGCVSYRNMGSCRQLAALPIFIGNSGAAVPQTLALKLQDAARAVCHSRQPYKDITGNDVTARECAHLASRFVIARDPEYRTALSPAANAFFEGIYEPTRTAQLTRVACSRPRARAFACQAGVQPSQISGVASAR